MKGLYSHAHTINDIILCNIIIIVSCYIYIYIYIYIVVIY
jgi:hypothetical protein